MTYVASPSRSIGLSDHYLVLLSSVLLGYAMLGKGFAYLGLPPLFIGEIALLSLCVLLRTGCLVAEPSTVPSLLPIPTGPQAVLTLSSIFASCTREGAVFNVRQMRADILALALVFPDTGAHRPWQE